MGCNAKIDPWPLARQRYLETLTEEEVALFTHASLENLFYSTSIAQNYHHENSKSRAFIEKLGPLVEAIKDYGDALDVFSNASSAIMCPLWGSIRVVLHIASEFEGYFEKLVEMLVTIGDCLPELRIYEKIYSGHHYLIHNLSMVYLDIITFCMDANKVFKNAEGKKASQVKKIWKPFKKQFGGVVSSFRRHRENLTREASVSHMVEAAKERTQAQLQRAAFNAMQKGAYKNQYSRAPTQDKITDFRTELKQVQLLQYLSSVDHEYRHRQLRKQRHENTGSWIFNTKEFKDWASSNESSCLWCYGIPGSGKTIITTSVVDALIADPKQPVVVYFYCDYSRQDTLQISEIFGSFIKQLLSRIGMEDDIQSKLSALFQNGARKVDIEELLVIFNLVLVSFDSVVFVLDGIDECGGNDRIDLLAAVQSILKPGPGRTTIKFFLASRADVDIKRAFENHVCLPISAGNITADIGTFVNGIVRAKVESRELVVRDPSLITEIVDALVSGAHGMFIWVTFQIDAICEEVSDNGIRKALRSLPEGLAETYTRALQKVHRSKTKAAIAQQIFKWMVCARRPLTIEEIKEAISISPLDKYLDPNKFINDSSKIVQACANLAVYDSDEGTLRFAHFSVQEFLLSIPEDDAVANIHFQLSDAKLQVGEICVTYLSFGHFETQITKKTTQNDTNTDLGILGSPFLLREAYIGRIGKLFYDGWARIRGNKWEKGKIAIDWTAYLRNTRPTLPTQQFQRQYVLLNYVIENWMWHTAEFSCTNTRLWGVFRALALERQLPFSFKPWGQGDDRTAFPYMPLFLWAVETGHAPLLGLLLEMPKKPGMDSHLGQQIEENGLPLLVVALHRSAQKGYDAVVKLLLENDVDLHTPNRDGDTAMDFAVGEGHASVVSLLLRNGSDPNTMNWNHTSFLYRAIRKGHEGVVKVLLECGANLDPRNVPALRSTLPGELSESRLDLDTCDEYGYTVLHLAAKEGHETMVKVLSEQGVNLNAEDNNGFRPLHHAAQNGHNTIVKVLIARGADLDAAENFGYTVLHLVARNGDESLIKLLLERGANLNPRDNSNNTPLHEAAEEGHRGAIKLLINQGADLNARDDDGYTALHLVARKGNETIVKLLSEKGADLNTTNTSGYTALHDAAREGHEAVVKLLLVNGADLTTTTDTGYTALHEAAGEGHETIVKLLLSGGADLNASTSSGYTALHDAARDGHEAVVKLLLGKGADPNTNNSSGCTPLHDTAREGNVAIARLLLSNGADLDARNVSGCTALDEAADEGNYTMVKFLLDNRASLDEAGSIDTALHHAAQKGHQDVVTLLLERGAELNSNISGETTLHVAARDGHRAIVEPLLAKGVEKSLKNNEKQTSQERYESDGDPFKS